MAKVKISEFNSNPALNTDIDSINIAEGCSPSGINDAIRELMAQLKDWQSGTSNDPYVVGSSGSLTLNQGTANGVAYLNGSKVVTSGSALTFSGSELGVNATSTDASISIKALTNAYASVLSLVANNDNGAQYNNISSSTSGGTVHWKIGGVAGVSQMPFSIAGSEQMRLTSTGLGIGTSSPVSKLHINADTGSAVNIITMQTGLDNPSGNKSIVWRDGTNTFGRISVSYAAPSAKMTFGSLYNSGYQTSDLMTLTASGNLGIGSTGPVSKLEVVNSGVATLYIGYNNTSFNYIDADNNIFRNGAGTERARIDSSGNLLVGTTAQASNERLSVVAGNTTGMVIKNTGGATYVPIYSWNATTTGDGYFAGFFTETSATFRGSITYNRGAGLVAYNTTSDYRAKDISGPIVNSGTLIDSVPVYMGKMKGATQERPMFIAHETPSYAHTGEKDAVDADGNPVYQQMDASALIPVMWAEIQSLRKRLADAGIA
jgi:hypothetical protein